MPAPLRWITAGMVAPVALYTALPIVMTIDRDATAASVMENTPTLSPAHLDFAIAAVPIYTWVLHTIDVVLVVWFVVKARNRRRWARIALTIYLIVATIASFISIEAGNQYYWAAILGDAIHVIMIGLLWLPTSMRQFFAGEPQRPDHAKVDRPQ